MWGQRLARFEITMSTGEKILVDHAAMDIRGLLAELNTSAFLLCSEVSGGTSAPDRDVIVASGEVTVVRRLDMHSTQSSTFRAKR
jgi:hypothetical protein